MKDLSEMSPEMIDGGELLETRLTMGQNSAQKDSVLNDEENNLLLSLRDDRDSLERGSLQNVSPLRRQWQENDDEDEALQLSIRVCDDKESPPSKIDSSMENWGTTSPTLRTPNRRGNPISPQPLRRNSLGSVPSPDSPVVPKDAPRASREANDNALPNIHYSPLSTHHDSRKHAYPTPIASHSPKKSPPSFLHHPPSHWNHTRNQIFRHKQNDANSQLPTHQRMPRVSVNQSSPTSTTSTTGVPSPLGPHSNSTNKLHTYHQQQKYHHKMQRDTIYKNGSILNSFKYNPHSIYGTSSKSSASKRKSSALRHSVQKPVGNTTSDNSPIASNHIVVSASQESAVPSSVSSPPKIISTHKHSRETIFDLIQNKQRDLERRLQHVSAQRAQAHQQQHQQLTLSSPQQSQPPQMSTPPKSNAAFGDPSPNGSSPIFSQFQIPNKILNTARDNPHHHLQYVRQQRIMAQTQKQLQPHSTTSVEASPQNKAFNHTVQKSELQMASKLSRMIEFYHVMDAFVQKQLKEKYILHTLKVQKKYEKLSAAYTKKIQEKMSEMEQKADRSSARLEERIEQHVSQFHKKRRKMKKMIADLNSQLKTKKQTLDEKEKKEKLLDNAHERLRKKYHELKQQKAELTQTIDCLKEQAASAASTTANYEAKTSDAHSELSMVEEQIMKKKSNKMSATDLQSTKVQQDLSQKEAQVLSMTEQCESKMRMLNIKLQSMERREEALAAKEKQTQERELKAKQHLAQAEQRERVATEKIDEYELRMEQLEYCRQQLQQARREIAEQK